LLIIKLSAKFHDNKRPKMRFSPLIEFVDEN